MAITRRVKNEVGRVKMGKAFKKFLYMFLVTILILSCPVYKLYANWSTPWDETKPSGTEPLNQGDDRIREFKTQVRERLSNDHYFPSSDTVTNTNVGYHLHCTLLEQDDDPDIVANAGRLYTKKTDGVPTLYFLQDTGKILRLTYTHDAINPDNAVLITGTQTITGNKTFSGTNTFSGTTAFNSNATFNDNTTFDSAKIHGLNAYVAPTQDTQFVPKKYVDDRVWYSNRQMMLVVDEKPDGTPGGTFATGAWRTRDLNTVRYNTIHGAYLDSNQVHLPAGVYYVEGSAPAFRVYNHRCVLYNVTRNYVVLTGTSAWGDKKYGAVTRSFLRGVIAVGENTVLEVRHHCFNTKDGDGFGVCAGYGHPAMYTVLFIKKLED